MSHLLGIDIGTTATKVSVAALDGAIVAEGGAPCTVDSPDPGTAQVDPAQWWDNIRDLVPQVLGQAGIQPGDIDAVGVSGMVPALLCLDADDNPLGPSIQQNDSRAWHQIAALADTLDTADVLRRTGSDITTQSIGPKVQWLRRHRPDQIARTSRICGSYDWIVAKLTHTPSIEANWALESGLFDVTTGDWAEDILDAAGVERDWLAPIGRSHELLGQVTPAAADATGLRAGTPVTAGAADHIASAFSAGLVTDGDLLVKLGGAGDILLSLSEPVVDARLFLDHHLVPGLWLLNGCMAASGSLLRWFQRELAEGTDFADLDRRADALPAGSDGLVCLPYFLGEKSPINDPQARGAFIGLHLGQTQTHLYRSVLEAVAYGFNHHIDVFTERGLPITRVRVTNGGSKSRLWRQIVADVTGLPLESLVDHPGSGLGSAFAAGVAVGLLEWSDIDRFARVAEVIQPNPATRDVYAETYDVYRQLHPAIAPLSHRLAALEGVT